MTADSPTPPEARRRSTWAPVVLGLLVSVLFHWYLALRLPDWLEGWAVGVSSPVAVSVIDGDPRDAFSEEQLRNLDPRLFPNTPAEDVVEEEPEPPEPPVPDGQIVDIPKPDEEKIPLKADYLAENNSAVPVESRTDRYKVNPEVLSNAYSEQSKYQMEDVADVGATDASTGATAGNLSQPADTQGKGAPRTSIPSRWLLTNKEGIASPLPSSSRTASLAGAPQNDLLNERVGETVSLNAIEFYGAEYLNRIRRQVNLYWKQNLDNLPSSVRLTSPRYSTGLEVVLTSEGVLERIDVVHPSRSEPIDLCIVNAFRVAGPFPNPPEQLISKDSRVYLPSMEFVVELGQASLPYRGVDPRSGVQFPGILRAPR